MKTSACKAGIWVLSFLVILLMSAGEGFAAKGSPGPPEGEGPTGDHGRKKDSDEQGLLLGLIFGDQWIIVRDVSADGDGKPIHFTWEWPPEAYNSEGDFDPQPVDLASYDITVTMTGDNGCVQPVSFSEVPGLGSQFEVTASGANYYDSYGRERLPTYLIPLDPECKVPDAFEESWGELVMEADAGRYNLSRSPQDVIDAAYEEALRTIDQAQSIGLDPAGRLLLSLEVLDEDELPMIIPKTIDSPAENLALFQKILRTGCLSDTENVTFSNSAALFAGGLGHLDCSLGDTGPDNDDLLRAASFLAGAGDKTGRVTIDLLVYLNSRLELNTIHWAANKKEITGIDYFDFGDFSYDRCATHAATTAALLQPAANGGSYPNSFVVSDAVPLFDKRFTHNWPTGDCLAANGNIFGVDQIVNADTPIISFVRAADDALTMIGYIHNFALPDVPMQAVEEPVYP